METEQWNVDNTSEMDLAEIQRRISEETGYPTIRDGETEAFEDTGEFERLIIKKARNQLDIE